MHLLITERSALTALINVAVGTTTTLWADGGRTKILAVLPVIGAYGEFDQDVDISWRDAKQFQYVRDAWRADRVRIEVSLLEHPSNLTTLADRFNAPLTILGYCGDNACVLCVRRRTDVDRVIVQLC